MEGQADNRLLKSAEYVKRKKKLEKRAANGDINERKLYEECFALDINVKVTAAILRDSSRSDSIHDLNVDELTGLICTLAENKPINRYFSIRNRGAVCHISILHVSNCDLDSIDLRSILGSAPAIVRVSKKPGEVLSLPHQLLTYSIESNTTPIIAKPTIEHYCLDSETMILWGYPRLGDTNQLLIDDELLNKDQPCLTSMDDENHLHEVSRIIAKQVEDEYEESPSKVVKLTSESFDEIHGSLASVVPNRSDADHLMALIKTSIAASFTYNSTLLCTLHPFSALFLAMSPISVVAIDCEMCETKNGLELTRLTLLDISGSLLLDMYIQPNDPVVDYRTRWSGITSEILSSVTHSMQQAQIAFLRIVSSETILVGHSLDSDLKAMRICHSRCVDTAIIFPHAKGYPYRNKLKYLALKYLKTDIQKGCDGHDSTEDARTALALAALKVDRGPSFGVPRGDGRESVFQSLGCRSTFTCMVADDREIMSRCMGAQSIEVQYDHEMEHLREDIALARRDVFSVHYFGVRCVGQVELEQIVRRYRDVVSRSHGSPGLLLVTAQPSISHVIESQRAKRACGSSVAASEWGKDRQDALVKAIKEVNMCVAAIAVI